MVFQDLGTRERRLRSFWLMLSALLTASLGVGAGEVQDAAATDEPTDFMRLREFSPGNAALETAIVTYAREGRTLQDGTREDGLAVDLIAAVHVGDAAYYRRLEKSFQSYESLLYEMIKPEGVVPEPGQPSDNLLSAFQKGLKEMLGLEFQLDCIDYRKKNFVHADLDPETFFRLQREKGEGVLSLLWKVFQTEAKLQAEGKAPPQVGLFDLLLAFSSSDRAKSLKLLLARQIEGMELLMAGFEGDPVEGDDAASGSVIVSERNRKVIEVLRAEVAKGRRTVGIFYGGGHMPDLERRLLKDFTLKKSKVRWLVAWNIGDGSALAAEEAARAEGETREGDPGASKDEPVEERVREF